MIGHGYRDGRALDPLLHDDVAPTVSDWTNPCSARILHTSRPDSTRSLPNRNLQTRYKDLTVETVLYFRGISRFKEQFDGFYQIASSLFDGVTLTRDVQFRTQGHIAIVLPFYDAGKLLELFHTVSLRDGAGKRQERNQFYL
jgi:hypothetical protein